MDKKDCRKVNRDEFLRRVATRLTNSDGSDTHTVEETARAMEDEFKQAMKNGERLSWMGIGSFYVTMHKGHPVQFGREKKSVSDYKICKFAPSNVFMKFLREDK